MITAPPCALRRFARFIRFNPVSGCVEWTGGRSLGHGKYAHYGAFWFERRTWRAHRWAAKYIHGQQIEHNQVDHECCNTLCVHHVQSVPPALNRELQWIRVQVGLEPPPDDYVEPDGIPFCTPPVWYMEVKSLLSQPVKSQEPPF